MDGWMDVGRGGRRCRDAERRPSMDRRGVERGASLNHSALSWTNTNPGAYIVRRHGSPVFTGIRLLYRMLLVMLAAVLCLALSDPQPRRRLRQRPALPPTPRSSLHTVQADERQAGGAAALTDRRISPASSPTASQSQSSSSSGS